MEEKGCKKIDQQSDFIILQLFFYDQLTTVWKFLYKVLVSNLIFPREDSESNCVRFGIYVKPALHSCTSKRLSAIVPIIVEPSFLFRRPSGNCFCLWCYGR